MGYSIETKKISATMRKVWEVYVDCATANTGLLYQIDSTRISNNQKGDWNMAKFVISFAALAVIVIAAGCGQQAAPVAPPQAEAHQHEHSVNGWCIEHEVPEDICSLCNKKVADQCKKDGDWCKEHDRAESQCFICNPQAKEKFAAQYKAQNGADPPKPHVH
jgi:hypothetical protein